MSIGCLHRGLDSRNLIDDVDRFIRLDNKNGLTLTYEKYTFVSSSGSVQVENITETLTGKQIDTIAEEVKSRDYSVFGLTSERTENNTLHTVIAGEVTTADQSYAVTETKSDGLSTFGREYIFKSFQSEDLYKYSAFVRTTNRDGSSKWESSQVTLRREDQKRKTTSRGFPTEDISDLLGLTSDFLDLTLQDQQLLFIDFLLKELESCLHRGLDSINLIDDVDRFISLDNKNVFGLTSERTENNTVHTVIAGEVTTTDQISAVTETKSDGSSKWESSQVTLRREG
ncbi:hypothetical protein HOLleu_16104 [Holothuria leucospilota]|uniref:Uncharacterized protein n=1 Tax=Holothuria leucospilota TaxID=206669 RepID=A0A9Q1C665_HOLLE|nr:hypothetical protein HOLleu_16104 [Holothuria leucospilota]